MENDLPDILSIHKSHPPGSFGLLYVSQLFLKIVVFQFFVFSVSCFVFFAGFLKMIAPGVGFSTIFLPQGSLFRTFLVSGG